MHGFLKIQTRLYQEVKIGLIYLYMCAMCTHSHRNTHTHTHTHTHRVSQAEYSLKKTKPEHLRGSKDTVCSLGHSSVPSFFQCLRNSCLRLCAEEGIVGTKCPNVFKELGLIGGTISICLMLCDPLDPARLLCPGRSPGQNTGVGGQALLQGIFQTHGLNLCLSYLLHYQIDSLPPVSPGKTVCKSKS